MLVPQPGHDHSFSAEQFGDLVVGGPSVEAAVLGEVGAGVGAADFEAASFVGPDQLGDLH